jgi:phage virion morphogenesis protein
MDNDLQQFARWAEPLLNALSERERLKLSKSIGLKLWHSQAQRIAAQRNPDGSPYTPRKISEQLRARQRGGRIRRQMFAKIRTRQFMRMLATSSEVFIRFMGRVARIANVHQEGLTDEVQPGGPKYTYPARQLLGFSQGDVNMIRDEIMLHINNHIL